MSKVAYVRVSTAEQNEARQREALAVRGIDKWFIEKASGKNTDRPEFQKINRRVSGVFQEARQQPGLMPWARLS